MYWGNKTGKIAIQDMTNNHLTNVYRLLKGYSKYLIPIKQEMVRRGIYKDKNMIATLTLSGNEITPALAEYIQRRYSLVPNTSSIFYLIEFGELKSATLNVNLNLADKPIAKEEEDDF